MGRHAPDLSVIIVSHGHEHLLPGCLGALAPSLAGLTTQTIIVDNLQAGGVARMLRGTDAQVIENAVPAGFAANANRGASASSGRCILLLNPDTLHVAGAMADLVGLLDARPDIGIVAATLLNADLSTQQNYRRFPSPLFLLARGLGADRWPWRPRFYREGLMTGERPDQPFPVDWAFGAFLMCRRADFERLGGMDPSYRLYYEDVDLCHRFRRAGLATYVMPSIRLVHDHGRASAAAPFSTVWRWHVASAARYFWKTLGRRADI